MNQYFLLNKNGNFAEIFQYTYYADTKRLLFTATDRRQTKWSDKDNNRHTALWKVIFVIHAIPSILEENRCNGRPYYKDST